MNYKRIYDSIIERAKDRVPEGYVERHHIIPRCMGGSDDRSNLVALTPEEHFLCHVLLVKIYPEHPGLIYAVHAMSMSKRAKQKRKLYGWLRRKYIERAKIEHLGKIWIHNIETSENKRISKSEEIPEGWARGFSESSKQNIREGWLRLGDEKRIFSEEHKLNMSKSRKGKPLSEEYKKNISKAMIGRDVSEETKRKISETLKVKNCECQHCGKFTNKSTLTRWHGENCKMRNG